MNKKIFIAGTRYTAPEIRPLLVSCEKGFNISGGFATDGVDEENGEWD